MMHTLTKLTLASLLLAPAGALGAGADTIGFSARIADNGRPVTGNHAFTFKLWNDPTATDPGTNLVWSEGPTAIVVNDGVVTAPLGDTTTTPPGTALPAFTGAPLYLEVTMDSTTFSPRLALQSVPYAMAVPWRGIIGKPTFVRQNQLLCNFTVSSTGFYCAPVRVTVTTPSNVFVASWQQFRANTAPTFITFGMCYRAAGAATTPIVIDGWNSSSWTFDLPDTAFRQLQFSAFQHLPAGTWDLGACGFMGTANIVNGNTFAIVYGD